MFDIYTMVVFGILGYFFRKLEFEVAPLVMAFVLGPLMENALRQSLIISHGSFSIFYTRPIATVAIVIALISVLLSTIPGLSKLREKMVQEKEEDT